MKIGQERGELLRGVVDDLGPARSVVVDEVGGAVGGEDGPRDRVRWDGCGESVVRGGGVGFGDPIAVWVVPGLSLGPLEVGEAGAVIRPVAVAGAELAEVVLALASGDSGQALVVEDLVLVVGAVVDRTVAQDVEVHGGGPAAQHTDRAGWGAVGDQVELLRGVLDCDGHRVGDRDAGLLVELFGDDGAEGFGVVAGVYVDGFECGGSVEQDHGVVGDE